MKALLKISFVGALCLISLNSMSQEVKPVKRATVKERPQRQEVQHKHAEGVQVKDTRKIVDAKKVKVKALKTN